MTAQFNPEVRALYDEIIRRNANRDNFEYMPPRYGGGRVREDVLPGTNGHYPSNEVIEASNMGGFYGRASHPVVVGSGRKCGGVGILKHSRAEPMMNELDQDYFPVTASHGAGRAPRLTKAMKDQILAEHPLLMQHHMRGGKIPWSKIWSGIKDAASFVSKAAPIAQQLAPEEYKDTIGKVGNVSGAISGMGRKKKAGSMAHMAAIDLARRAMSKRKSGAGFWQDFGHGFKQGIKGATKVAAPALGVASIFQPELLPLAAATGIASKAMGNGRHVRRAGRKQLPRSGHKREVVRGDIVAAIMKQRGVGLGEASRIVKQEGLY
jgi:hypothetical protein